MPEGALPPRAAPTARPGRRRLFAVEETGTDRYTRILETHVWKVPERFNIAADVCDARSPDTLAMIHEDPAGAVRELHWGELQALANQAANLLGERGVGPGDRVAVVLPPTPETAAIGGSPV